MQDKDDENEIGNNASSGTLSPAKIDEDSSIQPRDLRILEAIQDAGFSVFTFDGVRRLLGVHQETLSRTLDRLEDEGIVEKVPDGYRILENTPTPHRNDVSLQTLPLVHTMLPPGASINHIVAGLKGRWFGTLRWLGYVETDDSTVLKWITDEEAVQVDARFSENYLTIEARLSPGANPAKAINASYQLLNHVSRLYQPQRRKPGTFATPVSYYPSSLGFA